MIAACDNWTLKTEQFIGLHHLLNKREKPRKSKLEISAKNCTYSLSMPPKKSLIRTKHISASTRPLRLVTKLLLRTGLKIVTTIIRPHLSPAIPVAIHNVSNHKQNYVMGYICWISHNLQKQNQYDYMLHFPFKLICCGNNWLSPHILNYLNSITQFPI